MAIYYFFYVYASGLISSIVYSPILLWRGDFDTLGAMVLLGFGCFIGMCCNYPTWIRVFSGLYGITWNG